MERLFELFGHISDIVSSTQNALELLQKSRKEIRDLINNEFDEMIERITNQKMELLQSLSSKYQSKSKKLQTQLTFMKLHRRLISQKKKEFESISLNRNLSESERERSLITLTNAQIKKLNESLNAKKIIISSSINIQCLSFLSSSSRSNPRKRNKTHSHTVNYTLAHPIKECLNLMRHIKIVSFDNKRHFEQLYGEILIPINMKKRQKSIGFLRAKKNQKKLKKIKKIKKIKKNKEKAKKKFVHVIQDDVTSDGHIIHDSDDPDAYDDTKGIKLKLIDTESLSSSSSSSTSSNCDTLSLCSENAEEEEEAHDIENVIVVNESDTDSSSAVCIEKEEPKQKKRQTKKTIRNNPSYSIPSHSKSTVQTPPTTTQTNAQKVIKKSKTNQEDTKMDEITYHDELKDMEEELDGHALSKLRGKYGELCSFSTSLKSFGIGLTNHNKVAHKNHGNFNEDYILLDPKHIMSKQINEGVKCFRFHQNMYNYALWGVVSKNNEHKYDIKHFWGCCTENTYIKSGSYIHNKIQTEQWCGKLVDMIVDLNEGQLKYCSPNFIEPELNKNKHENQQLNQTIILNGIDTNKTWCVILKLKHKDTFVMVREIPVQWFGKYPKAVQFDTFTHV
eukprot:589221_1